MNALRLIIRTMATLLLWLHASTHSFSPSFIQGRTMTSVGLVPNQGKQLVAASCTVYKKPKDDDDITKNGHSGDHRSSIPLTEQRARSFVSRVFSLPAALRHPYSSEMVFPLVGFRRFRDGADARWLPTMSNVSCRLPPTQEPIYGWYSPVCRLSCSDDDFYCTAKREENSSLMP